MRIFTFSELYTTYNSLNRVFWVGVPNYEISPSPSKSNYDMVNELLPTFRSPIFNDLGYKYPFRFFYFSLGRTFFSNLLETTRLICTSNYYWFSSRRKLSFLLGSSFCLGRESHRSIMRVSLFYAHTFLESFEVSSFSWHVIDLSRHLKNLRISPTLFVPSIRFSAFLNSSFNFSDAPFHPLLNLFNGFLGSFSSVLDLDRFVNGRSRSSILPLSLHFRIPRPNSFSDPDEKRNMIQVQRSLALLRYFGFRHFFYHNLIQSLLKSRFCRNGFFLRSLFIFDRLVWEFSKIRCSQSSYTKFSNFDDSLKFNSTKGFTLLPGSDLVFNAFIRYGNPRFSFHLVRKGASKVSVPVLSRYHDCLKQFFRNQCRLTYLEPYRSLLARALSSFLSVLNAGFISPNYALVRSIRFYARFNRIDMFRFIHRNRSGRSFHTPNRFFPKGFLRGSGLDSIVLNPSFSLNFLRHSIGFYSFLPAK